MKKLSALSRIQYIAIAAVKEVLDFPFSDGFPDTGLPPFQASGFVSALVLAEATFLISE
jgi:hypothetical protein